MVYEYKIAAAPRHTFLESEVNALLMDRWELAGPLVCDQYRLYQSLKRKRSIDNIDSNYERWKKANA